MPALVILFMCLTIGLALFRSVRKSTSSILGNASNISGNNNDTLSTIIGDLEKRLSLLEKEKSEKQAILHRLENGEYGSRKTAYSPSALPSGSLTCEKCGHAIGENMRFCQMCGEAVAPATQETNTCSSCGSALTGFKKFCPECGKPVAATPNVQ